MRPPTQVEQGLPPREHWLRRELWERLGEGLRMGLGQEGPRPRPGEEGAPRPVEEWAPRPGEEGAPRPVLGEGLPPQGEEVPLRRVLAEGQGPRPALGERPAALGAGLPWPGLVEQGPGLVGQGPPRRGELLRLPRWRPGFDWP